MAVLILALNNVNIYGFCKLGLILFLGIGTAINPIEIAAPNMFSKNGVVAQVVPDQTLGAESSLINPNSDIDINGVPSTLIEGGAIRGANLFHSFEKFNVGEGRGVYFDNPVGIQRILSRVTGNGISEILGTLGVLGNADLFVINPNGIIFGPKVSLDVKGSFLATTASSLSFEDGTQFSAKVSPTPSLLTVSIPVGLQFRETAGDIIQQPTSSVDSNGIQGQPGKTLAFVGGNITVQGGFIGVRGGRIELGSVAGNGYVSLQTRQEGWALSYEGVQNFHDIDLIQRSSLFVENGDVQVQGQRLRIKDGSQITGTEGTIKVVASEIVEITGFEPNFLIFSGLANEAISDRDVGSITIDTRRLIIQDGGRISTRSTGVSSEGNLTIATGKGGDLKVNASESVELKGGETETGLFSSTESFGAAGNITINTGKLIVRDRTKISAESTGLDALEQPIATGQAGNIDITANSLSLNQGTITAETSEIAGEGGANITLKISDLLKIENESRISAKANGLANGGNIDIDTPLLLVFPPKGSDGSDIIATAARGNGGNITINAQGIFGIAERPAIPENQSNDIDASSEFGASGQVEIDNTIDPNRGLIELPETVVDPNALVAQNPCKQGSESEFVITGRGGLPPSLSEDLSSDATQVGLVEPAPIESRGAKEQESSKAEDKTSSPSSVPTTIIPAQGWVFNERGEVVLVAYDPTVTGSQRLRENGEGCTSP